jgi:predicted DNA binding CopG/RHH family protein
MATSTKFKRLWEKFGFFDKGDGTVGIRNPPKFRDEREEARWWERMSEPMFQFAAAHGLTGKRPARGVARPTSIRLRPEDVERLRKLAARRGLGYQTYLKMLLHEALENEERKAVA